MLQRCTLKTVKLHYGDFTPIKTRSQNKGTDSCAPAVSWACRVNGQEGPSACLPLAMWGWGTWVFSSRVSQSVGLGATESQSSRELVKTQIPQVPGNPHSHPWARRQLEARPNRLLSLCPPIH